MREKASFKVGVVAVAVLIVAATFLVPNPEGLAFEGKMLIGLLAAAIVLWVTEAIPILITAWLFAAAVPILGILSPGETWAGGGRERRHGALPVVLRLRAVHPALHHLAAHHRARASVGGEIRAKAEHPELCVGCGRCVNACPTHSISIYFV